MMQRARNSFRQSRRRSEAAIPSSPHSPSSPSSSSALRARAHAPTPPLPPPQPTAEAAAELRAAVAEAKLNRAVIEARGDQTRQLQAALQQALGQIEKIEREFARFRTQAEADRALYAAVVDENATLRARVADLLAVSGEKADAVADALVDVDASGGLHGFRITHVEEVPVTFDEPLSTFDDVPSTFDKAPTAVAEDTDNNASTPDSNSLPTPHSSPLSVSHSSLTTPPVLPTLSPSLSPSRSPQSRCVSTGVPVSVVTATTSPPPLPNTPSTLRRHSEAAVPLRSPPAVDKENATPSPPGGDRQTSAMSSHQGKPFERALSVRLLQARRGSAAAGNGKSRRTPRIPLSPMRRTQSGTVRRAEPSSAVSPGEGDLEREEATPPVLSAATTDTESVTKSKSTATLDGSVTDELLPSRRKRNSLRWSSVSGRCF